MHFYALEGGIKIKHKKIILTLAMLFVLVLAVSTVSAMDNITDDATISTSSNPTDDVVSVNDETDFVQATENQTEETLTIENNEEDRLESTDNDKISDSPGSFSELWSDISKGKLTRDYLDTEYRTHGLYVYDSVGTIDGDGHTIDCNNKYGIVFDIKTKSVTIKNCNFVNGTRAIKVTQYFNNQEICISDCNFTNCGGIAFVTPEYYSSSLSLIQINLLVKNCNFINCEGLSSNFESSKMAISHFTIENCTFSNSKEGTIFVDNTSPITYYFNILNCSFVNNTNRENGGAIHIDVDKESNSWASCELNITDSIFINNSASNSGGAIYSNTDNIEIHNAKFISNNAIKGAAIYVVAKNKDKLYVKINVDNSLFLENSGVLDDGIYVDDITHLYGSHINNCILLDSEYGSNPVVYSETELDGNYNWWGNTFDNPRQRPSNVNKLVVKNWLILNITSIEDNLYLGDVAQIKCNLSSVIDYVGNMNSYVYSNGLNVDFIVESTDVLDTFPFVSGYGEYNFTLNNAPISTVTIKCGNFQKTIDFNVNKNADLMINSTIISSNVTANGKLEYYSVVLIDSNGNPIECAKLILTRGNKNYIAYTNDEGIAIFKLDLDVGVHNVFISFDGTDEFKKSNATVTLNIVPVKKGSMIQIFSIVDGYKLNAILKDSEGDAICGATINYSLNNGNKRTATTDGEGMFSIDVSNNCAINMNYEGNEEFASSNAFIILNFIAPAKKSTLIDVPSTMTITAVDYNAGEKGSMFYFYLKDVDGKPVASKVIKIGIFDKVYSVKTDKNGRGGLPINIANANYYTYALTFLGDDDYKASFNVCSLQIVKKSVTITPAKTSYSFKASAKTKTVTATLKSTNSYIPKGKQVTLTIAGKTFKATIGAKGQISFNIGSITKKGAYKVTVNFAGTNTYAAATSKTITVKIS